METDILTYRRINSVRSEAGYILTIERCELKMNRESMNFYWMVGNRIRDIRMGKSIRVDALATSSGISTKHLYQIENGRVAFSTEILFHIARELQVSTDALLGLAKDGEEFLFGGE